MVIDLDDANRPWFFQIPQQGIKDDRRFWETIKQRVRRLKLKNVKSVGAFTLLRPVGKKNPYVLVDTETRVRYVPTKVHDIY